MKRLSLLLAVVLLCGFNTAYKNNPQTGKPDLVTDTMSATVGGAVPTPPNDATKFLNGAAGFTTPAGTYSLPTATSSILGGVKPDGTTILNTAGAISVTLASIGAQAAGSYVTSGGALGTPSSGTLTNCTFPTLNQNTTGSAAKWTTGRTITLTGGATGVSGAFDGSGNLSFATSVATANTSDYATGTWTVFQNAFTVVGSPTYTGTYTKIGRRVFCTIQISGTGTISSTVGTSYFSGLSAVFTPARREAVMVTNYGTDVGIGIGDLSTSGNVATPTWAAANNIVISFSFDI